MRKGIALLLACAGLLLGSAAAAPKRPAGLSSEECLACHADASLTKEVNGKQVSLDVHQDKFKASAHGVLGCTDCHTDVKAFPHDPAPAKPDCATCAQRSRLGHRASRPVPNGLPAADRVTDLSRVKKSGHFRARIGWVPE